MRCPRTSFRNSSVQPLDAPVVIEEIPVRGLATLASSERSSMKRIASPIANHSGIARDVTPSLLPATGSSAPMARGTGSLPRIAAAIASDSEARLASRGIRTRRRSGASTNETVSPERAVHESGTKRPGAAARAASRTRGSPRSIVRTGTRYFFARLFSRSASSSTASRSEPYPRVPNERFNERGTVSAQNCQYSWI